MVNRKTIKKFHANILTNIIFKRSITAAALFLFSSGMQISGILSRFRSKDAS